MTALATHLERAARYADATREPDFFEFCRDELVQSIDQFAGRPLDLEEWQREFAAEALALDESGVPCWRSVVLVLPRKNGKTMLLAAYALYRLLADDDSPEILLAASSDKQAGRLFDAVCSFVRRSPALADRVVLREYIGEIARADGGGKILRMSSEAGTLHGYNPSLVICDELHAWTTPKLRRAWAALTTGGGARLQSQTFTITTAGEAHERDSSILGRLIDRNEREGEPEQVHAGLTISRNHDARTLVYNYSAPTSDPADVDAMLLANPASWITGEYLARQAANPELAASEVLQLHGCVWAAGEDAFIASDQWAELVDAEAAEGPGSARVFLGFDGSRSYDTTVAAWAWRLDDGRIAVRTRVWSTRPDAPHHELVAGREIDFAAFERFIEDELFGRFDVREAAYDPRYLIRSMQLIEDRVGEARIAPVEPQSKLMRDALAVFYQLVLEGGLAHDGDPVLAQHVAAAKATQDERGWVVRKRVQRRPIDALIASVLAVWRCSMDQAGEFFLY